MPDTSPVPPHCEPRYADAVVNWALFFTGFMQSEGTPTPLEKLHRRVSARVSGPNSIVSLNSWRDNVRDKAQRIINWRNGTPPRVVVVGYSYGGWAANNLCHELQQFDVEVDSLLLCDPVGRFFGHLPTLFSLLDLFPLTVPANVRNLWTWRQTYNRPRGGFIRLEKEFSALESGTINAGTIWRENNQYKKVSHVNMDDLSAFTSTVMSVACGGIK